MKHKGTKTLKSQRLCLRKFSQKDTLPMFNNWANDVEVTKYLTWQPHKDISVTEFVVNEWIKSCDKKDFYQWIIVLRDTKEPVGNIGVVLKNDSIGMFHIGYCIGRKWWRQGITSEALSMVIKYLFDEVGATRIESRHDVNNPNSGKVMKKCGMVYEGTLRKSDINNQGICDCCYYSILKEDYEKQYD